MDTYGYFLQLNPKPFIRFFFLSLSKIPVCHIYKSKHRDYMQLNDNLFYFCILLRYKLKLKKRGPSDMDKYLPFYWKCTQKEKRGKNHPWHCHQNQSSCTTRRCKPLFLHPALLFFSISFS